jgi:C1A family cysteine protease
MKHNLTGWKKERRDLRDQEFKPGFMARFGMPREIDLSKSKLPRIEDQGSLGSCTCNAGTSAVEYVAIKLGKSVTELSRLFLYFAVRHWTEKVTGDVGAQNRDVVKTLAKFGVCHEATWPYKVEDFEKPPQPQQITEAKQHLITQYWRCPSLYSIKVCLAQGFPLIGGFTCPESLESDETTKTGIVQYPKPDEAYVGGHAVLFVGYNDATKLLKFENSWGTNWGDKGFGYLPYKYVETWLADDFWTVRMATGV